MTSSKIEITSLSTDSTGSASPPDTSLQASVPVGERTSQASEGSTTAELAFVRRQLAAAIEVVGESGEPTLSGTFDGCLSSTCIRRGCPR